MYCSKCGNEIKDGFLFCDKCGEKVETVSQEETSQEVAPQKEGVDPERLDYIMSLLNQKEENTEEVKDEPQAEEVKEETQTEEKKEVDPERLNYILGLLDEKEDVEKVEEIKEEQVSQVEPTPAVQEPQVQTQPVQEVVQQPVQTTIIQDPVVNSAPVNTVDGNRVVTDVVSKPDAAKVEEPKAAEPAKKSYLALISLIIGICCIPLAFLIKLWVVPIAIAGIITGALHKGKDGKKVTGIALSSASIPLAIIIAIVAGIFGFIGGIFDIAKDYIDEEIEIETPSSKSVFQADGYTLEYDYNWSVVALERTNGGNADALEYRYKGEYLAPMGISSLSESETSLEFDASTRDGRSTLFDYFSSYWISEGEENGKVVKEYQKFKLLTGDIYYAVFTYGKDEDTVNGHYLLLVSKESNAIISMATNCKSEDAEDFLDEALKVVETIDIEKQKNVVVDNEMYEYLVKMSAWNMYASARDGETLGKKINLNGTWKQLSDDSMAWKFKDGEFWYYESYEVTNDNYWYGTYEIYTGQDGVDKVGGASTAKAIADSSKGTVTEDSIYGVILKPTKIIMDGEDKSEEMISGNSWKYAWILVNHGSDGIEAQITNMNQASVYYYFKTQD